MKKKLFLLLYLLFTALITNATHDSTLVRVCTVNRDGDISIEQYSEHYIIEYDSAGNRTLFEGGYMSYLYTYDSLNNKTSETLFHPSNGGRVYESRIFYSWNINQLTQKIQQGWQTNSWVNSGKTDYFYSSNGFDSLQIHYIWSGQTWIISRYDNFYYPTGNALLKCDSVFNLNPFDSTFYLSEIDSLIFDANNHILKNIRAYYSDGIYSSNQINSYTYDSNGYQLSDSSSSNGDVYYITLTNYDAQGRLLFRSGECFGCGQGQTSYFYDAYGRLIHTSGSGVSMGGMTTTSECDVYSTEIVGPSVICENSVATLNADSGYISYEWSTGETTQSITISQPGTFSVTLTDILGILTPSAPFTITQTYGAVAPHGTDSTVFSCRNNSVRLEVPYDSHYSYLWLFSNDNQTFQPASLTYPTSPLIFLRGADSSGCYRLMVTSGCDVDTSSATCIQFSPDSSATITATGGITDQYGRLNVCSGDTITLTASQGFSYSWIPYSEITRSIYVTAPGTYSVNVYDSSGCYSTSSISVSGVYPSFYSSIQILPIDSGIILQPPYSPLTFNFSWFYNGDTIPAFHADTLFSPATGYYNVILASNTVCNELAYSNYLYYNQDSILVQAGADQQLCFGNNYTFYFNSPTVIHGTPPYSYEWSSSGIVISTNPFISQRVDSLSPGQEYFYVIKVTDANGFSGRDTIKVFVAPIPAAPIVTILNNDTICNDQQLVTVRVTPYPTTVSYQVNYPPPGCYANFNYDLISFHCAGTYTLKYTLNGCRSQNSIPIVVNSFPDALPTTISRSGDPTFCYGDSILLTVQNNNYANIQWTFNYNNLPGENSEFLTADHYGYFNVEVTDNNGCKYSPNGVFVTADTSYHISIDHSLPSVICDNDSVKLSFDATLYSGYFLQWKKNNYSIINANDTVLYVKETGNYSLTIYAPGDSCAGSSQSVFIQTRQLPTVTIDQNVNTLIANTTAWNYQWYNDGNILLGDTNNLINISSNGFYQVVVTDYHGCSAAEEKVVNCGATFSINNVSCHGSCAGNITAQLSGISPFTVQWSNGDNGILADSLCALQYEAIIIDSTGCIDTLNVNITEPTLLIATTTSDTALCYDQCLTVNANVTGGTSPYNFLWCDGSILSSAEFCNNINCQVLISDANGCTLPVQTFSINIPDTLLINATVSDTRCVGCSNGEIALSFIGGTSPYYVTWQPAVGSINNDTITGLPAGTYTITVSDSNNCTASTTLIVLDDPLYTPSIKAKPIAEIFPNPVHSLLHIKLDEPAEIILIDMWGRKLFSKDLVRGESVLDVSSFTQGVYFVKVRGSYKVELTRLVME